MELGATLWLLVPVSVQPMWAWKTLNERNATFLIQYIPCNKTSQPEIFEITLQHLKEFLYPQI